MGTEVKKRLGDILVEARVITPEQLASALQVQKTSGLRLGEVLVGLGYATELDVAKTLAGQLKYAFVADHQLQPDPSAVALIPENLARKKQVLPITEKDGRLQLAMVDPLDVFTVDEVTFLTGKTVEPVVVTPRAMERALSQLDNLKAIQRQQSALQVTPTIDFSRAVQGEEAPVVRLVNDIINLAIEERASDIHMEALDGKFRIRFRVDGVLREVMQPPIGVHPAAVSRVKVMASLDISERRIPQDGRVEIRDKEKHVDLRVSTLPTIFGEKVVIRILDKSRAITNLAQIGFAPDTLAHYLGAISRPYGMILVTGPTGSGKTTTLMATLGYLNSQDKNIITIEDPVEYQLPGINHVQINPKAGLGFANGLRSILRQDPNIIMIGEIRDGETADIAVRSALTGHVVFSTLHTNDAAGALTRLIDMGVEPFLIASSVQAVVAQRLARALCPRCKEPFMMNPSALERLGLPIPNHPVTAFKAMGCSLCGGTGYHGRLAIFELLIVSTPIRDFVTGKASAAAIRAQALKEGMRPLANDGVEKALKGLTTIEEIRRVAYSEEG